MVLKKYNEAKINDLEKLQFQMYTKKNLKWYNEFMKMLKQSN